MSRDTSSLQFEESGQKYTPVKETSASGVVRLVYLFSGGAIKTKQQAVIVLLLVAVLSLFLSLHLLKNTYTGSSVPDGELYYGGPG